MNDIQIKPSIFLKECSIDNAIAANRSKTLTDLIDQIYSDLKSNQSVNLNFICTHNSRRSQFAQVWAHYCINQFGIENCFSFSGGTATTAFHRNTLKALQKCGFKFSISDFSHKNPVYSITYEDQLNALVVFSKNYEQKEIKKPFVAITTCDDAKESCPNISNASHKFHLSYEDPKKYDNTKLESIEYDKTNRQIACEMHYLFSKLSKLLSE